MTGVVEMASIQPWKPNIGENHSILDDCKENGECFENELSIDSDKITEIPSWRINLSSKRNSGDTSRMSKSKVQHDSHVHNSFFLGDDGDNDIDSKKQEAAKMGKEEVSNQVTMRYTDNVVSASGNVVTAHLRHVQSNPFFIKDHGVIHPHGRVFGRSNSRNDDEDVNEQDREYGPCSGFVSKLTKKFASITVPHEEPYVKPTKSPRRFASVENLTERQKSPKSPVSPREKSNRFTYKSKTTDNYVVGNRKQLDVPKLTQQRRKYSDSTFDQVDRSRQQNRTKTRHEHHEAPDIKIGRDDIIIIEHSKPVKEKPKPSETESREKMISDKIRALKDEDEINEKPKPNTVASFRSMFEKGKILPDTPKVFTSVKHTSPSSTSASSKKADTHADTSSLSAVPKSQDSENDAKKESPAITTNEVVNEKKEESVTEVCVKPSTMKEKARDQPRLLDSPVTRKKSYPEKKSIFDSDTITSTKKSPVLRKSPPKDLQKTSLQDKDTPKQLTSTLSDSTKSATQENNLRNDRLNKSVLPIVKSKENDAKVVNNVTVKENVGSEFFPSRKEVFDSSMIQKVPKKKKEVVSESEMNKNSKSEEIFPERKQIFDSSAIETLSAHGKTKRAPDTPGSRARISSSEDKTGRDSASDKDRKVAQPAKEVVKERPIPSKAVEKEKLTDTPSSIVETPRSRTPKTAHIKDYKANKTTEKLTEKVPVSLVNGDSTPVQSLPVLRGTDETPVSGLPSVIANRLSEDTPTKGVPTVIANRQRKTPNTSDSDKKTMEDSDDEEEVIHSSNLRPSQLRDGKFLNGNISSPVPNKRSAKQNLSESSGDTDKSSVQKPKEKASDSVPVSNIDDLIRGKKRSPAPLFDSSSIVPKAKPKPSPQGVPPLDLSDLITSEKNHPYQEGYISTKIEPCKLKFAGAGVKLDSTPLKKTRSGHQVKKTYHFSSLCLPSKGWGILL